MASRLFVLAILSATSQCFPTNKPDGELKLDKKADLAYNAVAIYKRLDPAPPKGSVFRLEDGDSPFYLRFGNYYGAAVADTEADLEYQVGAFVNMLHDNPGSTTSAFYDVPTESHGEAETSLIMAGETGEGAHLERGQFSDISPRYWHSIGSGIYTILQRFGTWALTSIEIYTGDPNNLQPGDFIGTFAVGIPQGAKK